MFDEGKEPVDIFADVDTAPPPGRLPGDLGGSSSPGPQIAAVSAERHGPSKLLLAAVLLIVLGGVGFGVWAFFLRGDSSSPDAMVADDAMMQDDAMVADDAMMKDDAMEPASVCGNDVCEADEDEASCAIDCRPASVCGNDVCEEDEDERSCSADCRPASVCGNDVCEADEDEASCAIDCRPASVCGNDVCEEDESANSCPADCASGSTSFDPDPEEPVATTPPDYDGDGLPDVEEFQIGSDPQKADTDGDGLNDREEVRIYFTDPTDPDTDGDGYKDGDEVKNGYNPAGEGRLFQIPTQ